MEKIRVPLPLLASQIPPIDDVVHTGTLAAFRGKTWQADAADRTAPFPQQGWGELRQGPSQLKWDSCAPGQPGEGPKGSCTEWAGVSSSQGAE